MITKTYRNKSSRKKIVNLTFWTQNSYNYWLQQMAISGRKKKEKTAIGKSQRNEGNQTVP